MRFSPIKLSFNAGELSPLLQSRIDIDDYARGCDTLLNCLPLAQGPITKRGGTRFVAPIKDQSKRIWLAKFEFTYQQSFILEFGHLYIRFYNNRGRVVVNNNPYEIVTPFTSDMIIQDNKFALSLIQSEDIIYIACRDLPPYKLQRYSNTDWRLTPLSLATGPFNSDTYHEDENIHFYYSGYIGFQIISSKEIFTANDVGNYFYVGAPDINDLPLWEANGKYTVNQAILNDGRQYTDVAGTRAGSISPVHTRGIQSDGCLQNKYGDDLDKDATTSGIKWRFDNANYVIVKINAFLNTHEVGIEVSSTNKIPEKLLAYEGTITNTYAKASWSKDVGYPYLATFFRERLVFARDQTLWFSCVGDYENFHEAEFGQVTAESAITIDIPSSEGAPIKFLIPTAQGLVVGTGSGELVVAEATTNEAFSASNYKISESSGYGAAQIRPVRMDESILFVQRAARKIREFTYNFDIANFQADDLTLLSNHITKSGIIAMSLQRDPYSIIWMIRNDGKLIGLTFNRAQAVIAWHQHNFSGTNVVVESINCIPSPDGTHDDLWLVVKRTINNVVTRYIEYMELPYQTGEAQEDCFYVDSGLTYDGDPVNTITGLDHLEGQEIDILANGGTHPKRTIINGTITLDRLSSVVQIGLGYEAKVTTMNLEGGAMDGTSQGKTKRINRVTVRLLDSMGVEVGDNVNFEPLKLRTPNMLIEDPQPLESGDYEVPYPGGYEGAGRITLRQINPLPMTIISIMPQVTTYDKG